MLEIEQYIGNQLHSRDPATVKRGLANVLYWGYARIGYRATRVAEFRDNVSEPQIGEFLSLVQKAQTGLMNIKAIGLPQFSGVSFVSKVLMFVDPQKYCVLDNQVLRMREGCAVGALSGIRKSQKETQTRISKGNERAYLEWCDECTDTARICKLGSMRAVDGERSYFSLIQSGKLQLARDIYTQQNRRQGASLLHSAS